MAKKKPIISSLGQWAYPGEVTIIPSSKITMKGVNYPVLGVDDFGNSQVMMPGAEYEFPGNYVTEYPQMAKGGEMIKRKDGSYSKRGLWDNIRANKGSGKKPTKQMLEQERKIKAKMQDGGWLNNYPKSKVILPSVSQPELNPIAMTGLMKSKIAYADAFNNPTGARLTNRDSKSYTFTSDDEYNGGAPQGSQGNVYMSSYGEYATPQIQDVNGRLQFLADPWSPENVQRSLNQSIIFNEPDEAQYFGEHYKEVAPMMQSWNKKKNGGALNKSVTCSNCGWSWKLSEGGSDPLTCHKCGGVAKLQNGAQYTPAPDNRIYSDNARVTRSQPNNNSTPNIISLMPNIEKSSYGLLDKPQLKMMEVYSGKEQKPSEYLQSRTYNNPIANAFYKNKAVGVAADLVFDPLNILPTAILSKFKTLPGTVDKLNEIKKFYNTSKNLVQRADNISDFSELVGMQEGGWLQQYQVAGEVVQKPISEYKKQFEDEVKDLPSWYERNRAKINSQVPSTFLRQQPVYGPGLPQSLKNNYPFSFPKFDFKLDNGYDKEFNPDVAKIVSKSDFNKKGIPKEYWYSSISPPFTDEQHQFVMSTEPGHLGMFDKTDNPNTMFSHEISHYLNQNNPEVFLHNRGVLAKSGTPNTGAYDNFYVQDPPKKFIESEGIINRVETGFDRDRRDDEFLSDAYAIKQAMKKQGLYDYTKGEKLTPEILQKFKDANKDDFVFDRFNKVFSGIPRDIDNAQDITYLPKKDSKVYLDNKDFWDNKEKQLNNNYYINLPDKRLIDFYDTYNFLGNKQEINPSGSLNLPFLEKNELNNNSVLDVTNRNIREYPPLEEIVPSKERKKIWEERKKSRDAIPASQNKSSDEKMINFLNEIVKNNSNTNNYTAKYGGWLDSYKVGGSRTEDKPIIPIPPVQPTSKNKISFWDRMEYEKNPSNPNEYIKVNKNPEYYKFNSELDKAGNSEIQAYQNYLNENFNTFLKEDGVWNEDTKKAYDKYVINNENPQDLNKNKFKINSKQPLEFQYNDKGSLQVKATDAQFDPELKDWVDLKKLNPTLEEFKSIVDKLPSYNKYYENIYDADKSIRGLQQGPVDSQRAAEIKSSKQYQNLDPKYKEYLGKTFGTLPIVEKTGIYEGYSPSRMWTTPPGSKSKPWLGDDEVYDPAKDLRYLYFVTPKEGSVWAQDKYQKELENLSCLTGNCGDEYLNKGNSMFNVPTLNLPKKKSEKEIPFPTGDTWRLGQQAYAELLNNPAIVKYAKEKGIDLTDIGKDQFSPILAEALIGQRDANFNKKGVVIPHSRQYVPVIQDPNEFNLAGYLPITSDMFSANMNPNEKNQVLLNWDEKSKAEYFRKAGIPEDQWDNVYIHTSPFPISDYNASTKKYGGWLNKYQTAGEVSTEQNPERMNPIEIQTERKPWYERLPRQIGNKIGLDPYHLDDKDFGSQFRQRVSDATGGADWYKQSNPFMNLALEAMNAPQLAATYGVTGKVQTPSEAMDIQNPYGAMAVDMLLDPTNLVGAGIAKNLGKGSLQNMFRSRMRGVRPSIQNSVDNIATPNISQSASISTVSSQAQELPGLHLKSTMTDGPISKIVEPKTGLVNVEQALGIIGKESGGVDKVALIKQSLGENIPKKMDYNDFRKTVQDQLIPLEKQFSTERSNYGIDRLGYTPGKFVTKEVNGKKIHTYESDYLDNQTILFSNKDKFGRGSGAHGNPDETLGHAHYLIDKESPNALTVTQIQSDAFQGPHREMPKDAPDASKAQNSLQRMEELQNRNKSVLNKMKTEGVDEAGVSVQDYQIKQFEDIVNAQENANLMKKAEIENFSQKSLLDKNHQERYLQELVDYAGKQGNLNKVRVPTSETAAKVQNYKKEEQIISKTYIPSKDDIPFEQWTEMDQLPDMMNRTEVLAKYRKGNYDIKTESWYLPQHQTILKKYSEQPKTIKKLFGEEPKIVTDSKGNTWYEFDIPKKFKEGKGEIKAFSTIGGISVAGAAASQLQEQKNGGQTDWLNKYK